MGAACGTQSTQRCCWEGAGQGWGLSPPAGHWELHRGQTAVALQAPWLLWFGSMPCSRASDFTRHVERQSQNTNILRKPLWLGCQQTGVCYLVASFAWQHCMAVPKSQ